jgi:acetyl esterase
MSSSAGDPRGSLRPDVRVLFTLLNQGKATRKLKPAALRAGIAALAPVLGQGGPAVHAEEPLVLDGPQGPIRCRVFRPAPRERGPLPAVVFFHGGGYMVMSVESHARLARILCAGIGAIVVSVDYRMAPEHPFPAPIADCLAAFRQVRARAEELGVDPRRVAAAGDSAGGHACAAIALRLIAEGGQPPDALVLLCPWLDLTLSSASYARLAPDDPIIDDAQMRLFRDALLGSQPARDPLASPVLADVRRFPPTALVAAELDPLHDDAVAFAGKLAEAGVPSELQRIPGMPHDFMLFLRNAEVDRCMESACRFAREVLSAS